MLTLAFHLRARLLTVAFHCVCDQNMYGGRGRGGHFGDPRGGGMAMGGRGGRPGRGGHDDRYNVPFAQQRPGRNDGYGMAPYPAPDMYAHYAGYRPDGRPPADYGRGACDSLSLGLHDV